MLLMSPFCSCKEGQILPPKKESSPLFSTWHSAISISGTCVSLKILPKVIPGVMLQNTPHTSPFFTQGIQLREKPGLHYSHNIGHPGTWKPQLSGTLGKSQPGWKNLPYGYRLNPLNKTFWTFSHYSNNNEYHLLCPAESRSPEALYKTTLGNCELVFLVHPAPDASSPFLIHLWTTFLKTYSNFSSISLNICKQKWLLKSPQS